MSTASSHGLFKPITVHCRLNHEVLDTKIKALGITNAIVAEMLGITEEYTRRLRKRDSNIKLELLFRILSFFDLSFDEAVVYFEEAS